MEKSGFRVMASVLQGVHMPRVAESLQLASSIDTGGKRSQLDVQSDDGILRHICRGNSRAAEWGSTPCDSYEDLGDKGAA
eukprot:4723343-Amphidinium_carterae.1